VFIQYTEIEESFPASGMEDVRSEASWTVLDYKTGRSEKCSVSQIQLYGLAVQRAGDFAARSVVLEI